MLELIRFLKFLKKYIQIDAPNLIQKSLQEYKRNIIEDNVDNAQGDKRSVSLSTRLVVFSVYIDRVELSLIRCVQIWFCFETVASKNSNTLDSFR